MSNISIRALLSGLLGLIAGLFVISAVISFLGMSYLKDQTDFIGKNQLPKAMAGKALVIRHGIRTPHLG
jgi:hypothetical protein